MSRSVFIVADCVRVSFQSGRLSLDELSEWLSLTGLIFRVANLLGDCQSDKFSWDELSEWQIVFGLVVRVVECQKLNCQNGRLSQAGTWSGLGHPKL